MEVDKTSKKKIMERQENEKDFVWVGTQLRWEWGKGVWNEARKAEQNQKTVSQGSSLK